MEAQEAQGAGPSPGELPGPAPGGQAQEPPPIPRQSRGSLLEVAVVVLLALFIALLLKVYVAEAYEIKGKSMQPTFLEEERVMVLKVFYEIRRGDIVIFSSTENCQKDLIKRVVGLPGDRVEVKEGEVFINGEKLDEPYLSPKRDEQRWRDWLKYHEYKREDVPPGKYYVLGDNRPDSQDSRVFHTIDASQIKGKVVLRWWPLKKLDSF